VNSPESDLSPAGLIFSDLAAHLPHVARALVPALLTDTLEKHPAVERRGTGILACVGFLSSSASVPAGGGTEEETNTGKNARATTNRAAGTVSRASFCASAKVRSDH
jgi:hypothetical protein